MIELLIIVSWVLFSVSVVSIAVLVGASIVYKVPYINAIPMYLLVLAGSSSILYVHYLGGGF